MPRWLDGPLNPPSRQEQERYAAYYRDAEAWVRATFFPERDRPRAEPVLRDEGDLRFTPDLSPLETSMVDLLVRLCQELPAAAGGA